MNKYTKEYCPMCDTLICDRIRSDEFNDYYIVYYYVCKKCGFKGQEWYDLIFTRHTNQQGEDI